MTTGQTDKYILTENAALHYVALNKTKIVKKVDVSVFSSLLGQYLR